MHDVFVSYQHEDRPHAEALAAACEGRGLEVWWDRKIRAGDLWDDAIEEALDRARVVVLLWSANARKSPWVRAEVEEAAQRGNLLPALLDDQELPLRIRQTQALDLRAWRRDHADREIEALLGALATRLEMPVRERDAADSERWREHVRRVRRRLQIARAGLLAGFAVFALYAAGALDGFVGWDPRVRLISIWSRAAVAEPPRPELTLVVEPHELPGDHAPFRARVGRAIDQLSQAGARTIALAFGMEDDREGTEALASAIESARSRGTSVVLSAEGVAGERPAIDPPLLDALERRAPDRADGTWGNECVGHVEGFASVLPLLVQLPQEPEREDEALIPALSLAAVDSFRGRRPEYRRREGGEIVDAASHGVETVSFSRWERVGSNRKCRMIRGGAQVAELFLDVGALGLEPWSHRFPLQQVMDGTFPVDAARGRLVLIGVDNEPGRETQVWRGGPERAHGYQIHANAIATLLEGTALRILGTWSQLVILLLFASLAAAVRTVFDGHRTLRRMFAAGLHVTAIAGTFALAVGAAILMDTAYVLLAIALGGALAGRIQEYT